MTLEVRHLFVFYLFLYKVRYDQLFRLVSRDRSINSLFLYTLDCTYEEDDGMCDKIRGSRLAHILLKKHHGKDDSLYDYNIN